MAVTVLVVFVFVYEMEADVRRQAEHATHTHTHTQQAPLWPHGLTAPDSGLSWPRYFRLGEARATHRLGLPRRPCGMQQCRSTGSAQFVLYFAVQQLPFEAKAPAGSMSLSHTDSVTLLTHTHTQCVSRAAVRRARTDDPALADGCMNEGRQGILKAAQQSVTDGQGGRAGE